MERQTPETFPKIDADGHLYNPGEWNAGVAEELARRRGIALTSAHWTVLNDLHDYYFRFGSFRFGLAPSVDSICQFFGDKRERVRVLFRTCLDAWLIAGLPSPEEQARARLRLM